METIYFHLHFEIFKYNQTQPWSFLHVQYNDEFCEKMELMSSSPFILVPVHNQQL